MTVASAAALLAEYVPGYVPKRSAQGSSCENVAEVKQGEAEK